MNLKSQSGRVSQYLVLIVLGCLFGGSTAVVEAQAVEAGYRGPSYPSGTGGNEEVTAEKPESKLWWNDGSWWGSLWSTAGNAYHIYRLDTATEQWIDTGTPLDSRLQSHQDVLWDDHPANPADRKLYVASHWWTTSASAATSSQRGWLYRYSYDWAARTYNLDSGFPVEVNGAKSEALTIAKDSTGQLWVTWVENQRVMVNHSLNGNDASWGTPFALPVSTVGNVTSDDLSAVATFDGDKIVVMWSRQVSGEQMYAATHVDGAPDGNWQLVTAYATSGDDHMNLKSLADSAGRLFAVVKTTSSNSTGLIVVLVCKNTVTNCAQASDWASYPVYKTSGGTFDATRAILLIDKVHRKLYVFTSINVSGRRQIYYKISDMDNIQFPPGTGEVFISDVDAADVNNPTSTKQNLDGAMDLVVLASAAATNRYYHNSLDLLDGPVIPDIDVLPTAHDYGGVVVGANAFRTFAISNLGGANLHVSGASLVGGQAGEFAITQGGAPFTVAPGTTHNLEVRFTAAALGLRTTTLRLTSDDPDESSVNVALSGTGTVAAPDIAVTPAGYGYGTQPIGVGVTQDFTISNTGTMSLAVGASTLTGPDAGAFAFVSGQAGFTIAPGGNNTIQVRFTAPTAGPKSATLTIPSNDPDENPVLVALTGTGSVGTTTVEVRVATSSDDAEESATGSVSLTSSDLELVTDGSIQTVGMRFNGVAVPQGAAVLHAWIQFQTKSTGSAATSLSIQGQAVDTAATFTTTAANLSSRSKTTAAAPWSPVPWNIVGATGPDQQTPDISAVVQEIVNRAGWSSGNSLAILITGTGMRTAWSYNGLPTGAPLLHVEFVPGVSGPSPDIAVVPNPEHDYGAVPVGANASKTFAINNLGSVDLQVTGTSLVGGQVAEFAIVQGGAPFTVAPGTTHNLDVRFAPTSFGVKTTTLRLTSDDPDENLLDVALTGTGVTLVPDIAVTPTPYDYGAWTIGTSVTRGFTVSNTGTGSLVVGASTLTGPDAGAFAFVSGQAGFTIAPGGNNTIQVRFTAPTAGPKSATLTIPSNDPDENPVLVALTGTGSVGTTTVEVRVATSSDDAEESATGSVSLTSSDLELVTDGSIQTVGMRFNGVAVPQGAAVLHAWIQFQTKSTGSAATSLSIQGQAVDTAATFTTTAANLSSRSKTTAAAPWSPVPWNVVGATGPDQQTPDISAVVQEIVNRAGWSSGNSLAILITGTGMRTAWSYNGLPTGAPLLHVEFVPGVSGPSPDIAVVPNPEHDYGAVPVGANASKTFAINNLGSVDLQVTGTSLVGGQVAEFAIVQGGAPFTVAPGTTHNLDVRFAPTSFGVKTTTLRLTSDDPDESMLDVALSGTGSTPADIDVAPTAHDYGGVVVGANAFRTFVIRNLGGTNLQVSGASLVGGQSGDFAITQGGAPFTVAPGATHNLEVRFTPAALGLRTTTLRLTSDDADENLFDVALSGTGSVGTTTPTFEEVQQGGSADAITATTATNLIGVTGHLYLAAISTKPYGAVSTVTGLGLTWTRVTGQCAGRSQTGIELWWAQGAATTGTVTATLTAAPHRALIAVARYSGVASTNPVALAVAGNTNGVNGACANGTDSAAYSFNVTTTQTNSMVFGAAAIRSKTHTPGSGYTERGELAQGSGSSDMVTIALADRAVPTVTSLPLNGTLSGAVDWAVIGIQLRPGTSGP